MIHHHLSGGGEGRSTPVTTHIALVRKLVLATPRRSAAHQAGVGGALAGLLWGDLNTAPGGDGRYCRHTYIKHTELRRPRQQLQEGGLQLHSRHACIMGLLIRPSEPYITPFVTAIIIFEAAR